MIRRLNIILGAACNRHCPYCCQASPADRDSCGKSDWSRLRSKLLKLNESGELRKLERIAFWGGEPMLYWSTIQALYRMLCNDGIYPHSAYRVATNGDLINDDYVRFANSIPEWLTTVSWHDGSIAPRQWEVLKKLRSCIVTGLVTSSWRRDLPAMRKKYLSLGLQMPVQLWPVHFAGQCAGFEKLTNDDVDESIGFLQSLVESPQDGFSQALRISIMQHCSRKGRVSPDCGDESILTIDLLGREYLCQHNPAQATARTAKLLTVAEQSRAGCRNCIAWEHCGGGCFLSANREIECRFYKKYVRLGRSLNEAAA